MEEFEICIDYRNDSLCFPCRFMRFGYSYYITVNVYEREITFEPDEERNFRARIEQPGDVSSKLKEIVALIAAELTSQLK